VSWSAIKRQARRWRHAGRRAPLPGSEAAAGCLAHIRAVPAVWLTVETSEAFGAGCAWSCSERRIRSAARTSTGHLPDAEVHWPEVDASPYAGQCWAIEAELTLKAPPAPPRS
jgi:hypothetical protein